MFEKLYKEANDEIKIDEELIEKTLQRAYAPRKRKITPAAYYSVAAAIVLVIGVSAAMPYLTKEPQKETSIADTFSEEPSDYVGFSTVSPGDVQTAEPENTEKTVIVPSAEPTVKAEKASKKKQNAAAARVSEKPKKSEDAKESAAKKVVEEKHEEQGAVSVENAKADTAEDNASSVSENAYVFKAAPQSVAETADEHDSVARQSKSGGAAVSAAVNDAAMLSDNRDYSFVSTDEYLKKTGIDLNSEFKIPEGFENMTPDKQNSENGYFCFTNERENKFIYIYTTVGKAKTVWSEDGDCISVTFCKNGIVFTVESYGLGKDELEEIINR